MSTQLPAERLEGQVTSQVVIDAAGIGKTVRVVQTPAQAMVAGTQISIPHGLGAVPDPASIKANLVCVNANNGFNPGDVVDMDAFYIQADTSGGSTGGSTAQWLGGNRPARQGALPVLGQDVEEKERMNERMKE